MRARSVLPLLLSTLAISGLVACRKKPVKSPVHETSGGGSQDLDRYDEQVSIVRDKMPNLDSSGTAVVLRVMNVDTGKRFSIFYADEQPPEMKEKLGGRLIVAHAEDDKKRVFSTVAIFLKAWEPGTYECNGPGEEVAIGANISDHWDPQDPNTFWTMNGGECLLKVSEGPKLGDWELEFEAKLRRNDGKANLVVPNGYAYVKRF